MRAALSLALAALTLGACAAEPEITSLAAEPAPQVQEIDAAQLAAKVAAGEVILIDVRTPEEFAQSRISGALNAPVDTFDPAMIPLEDGRETILYCRSDRRSGIAAAQLAEYTGGAVRHLDGGILAWEEAGQPVIASPPKE